MESEYLGKTVRDEITKFEGVVTGHVVYLTGCNQLLVQPKCDDKGQFIEARWFDEDRCWIVWDIKSVQLPRKSADGFDKAAPVK